MSKPLKIANRFKNKVPEHFLFDVGFDTTLALSTDSNTGKLRGEMSESQNSKVQA
jgi:hypothetical protein